jgi:DNA-binding response OmpR family regulator
LAEVYKDSGEQAKAVYFFEKCTETQQNILNLAHQRGLQINPLNSNPLFSDLTDKPSLADTTKEGPDSILYWGLPLLLTGVAYYMYRYRKINFKSLIHTNKKWIGVQAADGKNEIAEMITDLKNQMTVFQNSTVFKDTIALKKPEAQSTSLKLECQDLLRQAERILYWKKIQNEALPINETYGNLKDRIGELLNDFRHQAEQKNISWMVSNNPDPINMQFDVNLVNQVYENLICFVIEYSPLGSSLEIQLDLKKQNPIHGDEPEKSDDPHAQLAGTLLVCTISNRALDPPVQTKKIPFGKKSKAGSISENQESDIRLKIASKIIRNFKGNISVDYEDECIKQIKFCWPVVKIQLDADQAIQSMISQEAQVRPTITEAGPSHPLPNDTRLFPHILLIETDKYLIELIREALKEDFKLYAILGNTSDLEEIIKYSPDLIICNADRPEEDRFKLCQVLKKNPLTQDIPIILLSSNNDISEKISALDIGVAAYLPKPFYLIELKAQITHLLKGRAKGTYGYIPTDRIPKNDLTEISEDPFIIKLNQFIQDSIDQRKEISIDGLCQFMALSRMQLHRKIKSATGQSATLYIRSFRLNKARILLQYKNLNVTEAAYSVGFEDPKYFSRVYHEEFGTPPSRTNS